VRCSLVLALPNWAHESSPFTLLLSLRGETSLHRFQLGFQSLNVRVLSLQILVQAISLGNKLEFETENEENIVRNHGKKKREKEGERESTTTTSPSFSMKTYLLLPGSESVLLETDLLGESLSESFFLFLPLGICHRLDPIIQQQTRSLVT